MSHEEEIEKCTLKFVQQIQRSLGENRNNKLGAYYRWHEQNLLENIDERLGFSGGGSTVATPGTVTGKKEATAASTPKTIALNSGRPVFFTRERRKRRINVDSLCGNCLTPFKHMRIVPKKHSPATAQKKHIKKKLKRGINFKQTLFNARCHHCDSKFKFNGFNKQDTDIYDTGLKIVQKKQNNKNEFVDKKLSKQPEKKAEPTKESSNKPVSSVNKSFKSPVINQSASKTVQSNSKTSSQKAFLQKLLGDSSKNKNKKSNDLGNFLSNCFK